MFIKCLPYKSGSTLEKDIAYGVLGMAVGLPLGYGTMQGAGKVLRSWGMIDRKSLGIVSVYESFSNFSSTILKVILFIYATIFIPICEEWIFRNKIYECQETQNPQKETWIAKCFRVISNGILFGLIHFNPLHMVVASVTGVVFAFLREITGHWRASAISHSLNNVFIMTQFLWT